MIAPDFPRVEIPGVEVDPEVRTALHEAFAAGDAHEAHIHKERQGMLVAMFRLGYKPGRSTGSKRKPTAHVRRMRKLAQRSQRGVAA